MSTLKVDEIMGYQHPVPSIKVLDAAGDPKDLGEQLVALNGRVIGGLAAVFDVDVATQLGGYSKGAVLLKADGSGHWISYIDNNSNDPDTDGTGWNDLTLRGVSGIFDTYNDTSGGKSSLLSVLDILSDGTYEVSVDETHGSYVTRYSVTDHVATFFEYLEMVVSGASASASASFDSVPLVMGRGASAANAVAQKLVNQVAAVRVGLPFDSAFAATIGGYPKGAQVLKANGSGYWISTADANSTDPDAGGAGWESIDSVVDISLLGAVPGVDCSEFLQQAVDMLPTSGGTIRIRRGAWVVNTAPTLSGKNIFFDIDPGATFSGTGVGSGLFTAMATNVNQLAVGPYIRCQSTTASPASGGIGAFNVEMLPPVDYVGQSVAIFAGARSAQTDTDANVWAQNLVTRLDEGFAGHAYGLEIDIRTDSASGTAKGIQINGIGNYNATTAIEITRDDSSLWTTGIHVLNAITGIKIENTAGLVAAIQIGSGPLPALAPAFTAKQLVDGAQTIILARRTDTTPSGNFLKFVNTDNTSELFAVDVAGNLSSAGTATFAGNVNVNVVFGQNLVAQTEAVARSTGQLGLGSGTATSAAAGAQTLPANPVGFLKAYLGATAIRIPYYGA